jgi:hypothetical protein
MTGDRKENHDEPQNTVDGIAAKNHHQCAEQSQRSQEPK